MGAGRYDGAFRRTCHRVEEQTNTWRQENQEAPQRLAQLVTVSPAQRALLIDNSAQFATAAVVLGLLHRARRQDEAPQAQALAQLALELVPKLSTRRYSVGLIADLRCYALVELASAQERLGRLAQSQATLRRAEYAQHLGSGDAELEARLLVTQARWLARCYRYPEAFQKVRDAEEILQEIADRDGETALRVLYGRWLLDTHQPGEASWELRRALRHAAGQQRFEAICALAEAVAALGDVVKARRLLASLASEGAPTAQAAARLAWLEGCVSAAEGSPELAVHFFREAHEAFVRLGCGDEADRAERALDRL
ncbi:MAG: hypothetical protein AAGD01_10125 [Acidobacteriota bacterium]